MGALTKLVRREQRGLVTKDRQASPARLESGAATAAYTWDGKVAVQDARVLRHWAKTSEWANAAIKIRRTQVSSADWDIVPYDQRKPYSKRQQASVRALFQTPNPANDSYRTFIEPVTNDLLMFDAGCIEKVRNINDQLLELWPVNGAQVKVNALWDGDPKSTRYYWYPDYKERARWNNDDFIYMMLNPGTDTPIGQPPLQVLRATIEAELAAHEYNRRQVENAAPDGIINLGEGFTETQVNRFREFFESEVAGRGPLGFIGGSKSPSFIKFRDSNRDQQFLEWQIYLVRKIAAVFGLTPQDLGVTFDINRSTAETQIQISEDRGLRPMMSALQEYLTEEVVWDRSFGGPANNLAFRFTALNLKESTAKAAIYEKALAGVPWRFINEARLDEGREPIPEMEGKLIMATPQGALDISDVPTVREFLEMQQAKASAGPAPSQDKALAEWAGILRTILEAQRAPAPTAPTEIHTHIDKGAIEVNVENNVPPTQVAFGEAESGKLDAMRDQLGEVVKAVNELPAPIVNVAAPEVHVAAPEVNVPPLETKSFTDAIRDLRVDLTKGLAPVSRREVKRDKSGRITEVVDHRGE